MSTFYDLLISYEQALAHFRARPQPSQLLALLLARDTLANFSTPLLAPELESLTALDQEFRQATTSLDNTLLSNLAIWRANQPQANPQSWWWQLDSWHEEQAAEQDTPYILATGILILFTLPMALEIIKRLWDGAPDAFSIFGTLLTLLLTGGSLSQKIRELGLWGLKHLPGNRWGLKRAIYAEVGALMAFIGFIIVLSSWWWGLPALAVWYNNWGTQSLELGNMGQAKGYFQRSIALNPENAQPYYHLGFLYDEIAEPKMAESWYQQAIQQDANFVIAYQGLGRFYNQQGSYTQAETILLAGLERAKKHPEPKLREAFPYYLLANLGWAYFEQGKYELAKRALTQTLEIEPNLAQYDGYQPQALPHLYLAQLYTQQEQWSAALQEWEQCIGLLSPNVPTHQAMRLKCQEGFKLVEQKLP